MVAVWLLVPFGVGADTGRPGSPPGGFPEARAFELLVAQCALGPRNPGSQGHRAGLEYIRRILEKAGGRVTLQSFLHRAPGLPAAVELTNIVGKFGPSRGGGLLLGAHWDTRPWAEQDPDPTRRAEPIIGANDGASGTALLLALAETFRDHPPEIPVTLVFFDGEDLGREAHPEEYLAGSKHFAAHIPAPYPEAALVVDMVASETMQLAVEHRSRSYFPDFAALIDQLAAEEEVTGYLAGAGPAVIDDHLPLIEAGIPTVLLIDFRDPYWHTHRDVPNHCSATNLGAVGRLILRVVTGGFFR
jgi:hypothetical protein